MIEKKSIPVSLGNIRYLQAGSGNINLVYIHGGFGDTGVIRLLEQCFGHRYKIIVPFLPGHGSFDFNRNFTYQDLLSVLSQFITKLGFKDYLLVGHSFGGRIVLDLPVRAKKVISLAPMLSRINPSLPLCAVHIAHDYLSDLGLSLRGPLQKETLWPRFRNISPIWNMITAVPDITNKSIRTPTCIIFGENDSVLPLSVNAPLFSKVSGAEFRTYPGGHYWSFTPSGLDILSHQLLKK
jgi:pimeloyl-ACP methyl ester carboxylesterase